MYVVYVETWPGYHDEFGHSIGGYVRREDGMVWPVKKENATRYATKEEASQRGQIGHHRDMGGRGFIGRAVKL